MLHLQGAGRGLLRVVGNDELVAAEKKSQELMKVDQSSLIDLAGHIRNRFEKAVRHRRTVGIDDELIRDMRAYNGQYDPTKMQEIQRFGGSAVYSRMMAMKCRGATALLRNVYMNSDRPPDELLAAHDRVLSVTTLKIPPRFITLFTYKNKFIFHLRL